MGAVFVFGNFGYAYLQSGIVRKMSSAARMGTVFPKTGLVIRKMTVVTSQMKKTVVSKIRQYVQNPHVQNRNQNIVWQTFACTAKPRHPQMTNIY